MIADATSRLRRAAVTGANGTTGTLVVEEARGRGIDVVELRRASFTDLASAIQAAGGADVVINCAGPFFETRATVEDACARMGLPVVHLCGEPSELRALLDSDGAQPVVTVGGAAFSPALAELAVWLALRTRMDGEGGGGGGGGEGGGGAIEQIDIIHAATSNAVPSLGSLRSYLRDVDLAAEPNRATGTYDVIRLPAPFGERAVQRTVMAEDIALRRSAGAGRVNSFVDVGPPRIVAAAPSAYMRDRAALERMIAHRVALQQRGPTSDERRASRFVMVVRVARANGTVTVTMSGSDPYGLTAILAVQTANDVVAAERQPPGRTLTRTALEVLDAQAALAAVARAGVRWKVERSSSARGRPPFDH